MFKTPRRKLRTKINETIWKTLEPIIFRNFIVKCLELKWFYVSLDML